MAAVKGPDEVGVGRGWVGAGTGVAVSVACRVGVLLGAGEVSVGAACVAAGADVLVGGATVGAVVGGTFVGGVLGAVVAAEAGAEVGAAGCELPQAANVINNNKVRLSRSFMLGSPGSK